MRVFLIASLLLLAIVGLAHAQDQSTVLAPSGGDASNGETIMTSGGNSESSECAEEPCGENTESECDEDPCEPKATRPMKAAVVLGEKKCDCECKAEDNSCETPDESCGCKPAEPEFVAPEIKEKPKPEGCECEEDKPDCSCQQEEHVEPEIKDSNECGCCHEQECSCCGETVVPEEKHEDMVEPEIKEKEQPCGCAAEAQCDCLQSNAVQTDTVVPTSTTTTQA